jgi:hypothetical protein
MRRLVAAILLALLAPLAAMAGWLLWTSEPPAATLVLGSASLNFGFGASDEAGLYSVQAKVTDRIGRCTLELSRPLRLE